MLAEDDGHFHNYSTFVGKPGIFLEDLFVLPEYRGCGHGKALFQAVAWVAVERGARPDGMDGSQLE